MNASQKLSSVVIVLLMVAGGSSLAQPGPSNILRNILVQADSSHAPIVLTDGLIQPNELIHEFYRTVNYQLQWTGRKASELINVVQLSADEGLNPDDYHLQPLQKLQSKTRDEYESVVFDLLLSDSFFRYGTHLLYGKEDPCVLYKEKWEPDHAKVDLIALLNMVLASQSVAEVVQMLKPNLEIYQKLKDKLEYFRSISNMEWLTIPQGNSIVVGDSDVRVPMIRTRLAFLGQYEFREISSDRAYDSLLYSEVKSFQERNGLVADGIIESHTIESLNHSVNYYIEKIQINLERCRWLSQTFGDRYIIVNVPAFYAEVWEQDSLVLSMKVIVGRPDRMTPVFSSRMSYFICNPTWTVPPTILEEDVLPAVKRNIGYLARNHLRVFDRAGGEVSPDSLPWSRYTISNFPYILRQDPGTFNSLGLIKFEFPNHYSVYLHDTNNRALFRQPFRALSSGCIRIEKPFELAEYLLKNNAGAIRNFKQIRAAGTIGTISFSPPMAVHVVYLTAFVDRYNQLNLRNDLYGWDAPLIERFSANR